MTDLDATDRKRIAHRLGYDGWNAVPRPVRNNLTDGPIDLSAVDCATFAEAMLTKRGVRDV